MHDHAALEPTNHVLHGYRRSTDTLSDTLYQPIRRGFGQRGNGSRKTTITDSDAVAPSPKWWRIVGPTGMQEVS